MVTGLGLKIKLGKRSSYNQVNVGSYYNPQQLVDSVEWGALESSVQKLSEDMQGQG